MQRLLIDQADITQTRSDEAASPPLAEGQARLRLDRFALTANNVTYAAAGFAIGYWKFFPSGVDGQGLLPVWGFAEVVESQSGDASVGDRFYGFFPLADEVVLMPAATGSGLRDAAPHRAALPIVYNRYSASPTTTANEEALQALLQPLLATSFLLADWLADNAYFGAKQVIIGSASSKTGLGLAKFLAEAPAHPVQIVGLTSDGNVDFVESLGAYDRVLSYDQIDALAREPAVYVDMAGNAAVKAALHSHLDGVLRHSCAVGTSHWDKFQPGMDLKGPKPEFFFAPAQMEKRRADWGPGEVQRRVGEAVLRIAAGSAAWLNLVDHDGWSDVARIYADLVSGHANPRDGHVFSFG